MLVVSAIMDYKLKEWKRNTFVNDDGCFFFLYVIEKENKEEKLDAFVLCKDYTKKEGTMNEGGGKSLHFMQLLLVKNYMDHNLCRKHLW